MNRDISKLNALARTLLTSIRRDVADLIETDLRNLPSDRMQAGKIRLAVRDAREGIVHLSLDCWTGRVLGDAERKAAHRALDQLVALGFLDRLTTSTGRTTHVRLIDPEPDLGPRLEPNPLLQAIRDGQFTNPLLRPDADA